MKPGTEELLRRVLREVGAVARDERRRREQDREEERFEARLDAAA